MAFEDLNPPRFNYVDATPKAEDKALSLVEQYIASLQRNVAELENLRDSMAIVILDLCKMVRKREDDFLVLASLSKVEEFVRKM